MRWEDGAQRSRRKVHIYDQYMDVRVAATIGTAERRRKGEREKTGDVIVRASGHQL